jgi:hypothetical protein
MKERAVQVSGNPERLRLLGFKSIEPEPPTIVEVPVIIEVPAPVQGPRLPERLPREFLVETPVLEECGKLGAPIEEKARILTEEWLNSLTPAQVRGMGAVGIEKVAKLAGLGGTKKADPTLNPVIVAIIAAVRGLGIQPPAMKVIECDPPDDGGE